MLRKTKVTLLSLAVVGVAFAGMNVNFPAVKSAVIALASAVWGS